MLGSLRPLWVEKNCYHLREARLGKTLSNHVQESLGSKGR